MRADDLLLACWCSLAGDVEVRYVVYEDERQLGPIMALVDRDLSEPYSIFTYRYFLNNWPDLCFVVGGGGMRSRAD